MKRIFFVSLLLFLLTIVAQTPSSLASSAAFIDDENPAGIILETLTCLSFDNGQMPASIRVKDGSPSIVNGQLELQSSNGTNEQVGIYYNNLGYDLYIISFSATASNTDEWDYMGDGANFFIDVPGVATTNWAHERIYHRDYVNAWSEVDDKEHIFSYYLNFSLEEDWLMVYMDGRKVYDDILINSSGDLRSIRFNVYGDAKLSIGNICVNGSRFDPVPIPSSLFLLSGGLLGLIATNRRKTLAFKKG